MNQILYKGEIFGGVGEDVTNKQYADVTIHNPITDEDETYTPVGGNNSEIFNSYKNQDRNIASGEYSSISGKGNKELTTEDGESGFNHVSGQNNVLVDGHFNEVNGKDNFLNGEYNQIFGENNNIINNVEDIEIVDLGYVFINNYSPTSTTGTGVYTQIQNLSEYTVDVDTKYKIENSDLKIGNKAKLYYMYSYDYGDSYYEDERYYYRYTLKLNPNEHVYVYWNGSSWISEEDFSYINKSLINVNGLDNNINTVHNNNTNGIKNTLLKNKNNLILGEKNTIQQDNCIYNFHDAGTACGSWYTIDGTISLEQGQKALSWLSWNEDNHTITFQKNSEYQPENRTYRDWITVYFVEEGTEVIEEEGTVTIQYRLKNGTYQTAPYYWTGDSWSPVDELYTKILIQDKVFIDENNCILGDNNSITDASNALVTGNDNILYGINSSSNKGQSNCLVIGNKNNYRNVKNSFIIGDNKTYGKNLLNSLLINTAVSDNSSNNIGINSYINGKNNLFLSANHGEGNNNIGLSEYCYIGNGSFNISQGDIKDGDSNILLTGTTDLGAWSLAVTYISQYSTGNYLNSCCSANIKSNFNSVMGELNYLKESNNNLINGRYTWAINSRYNIFNGVGNTTEVKYNIAYSKDEQILGGRGRETAISPDLVRSGSYVPAQERRIGVLLTDVGRFGTTTHMYDWHPKTLTTTEIQVRRFKDYLQDSVVETWNFGEYYDEAQHTYTYGTCFAYGVEQYGTIEEIIMYTRGGWIPWGKNHWASEQYNFWDTDPSYLATTHTLRKVEYGGVGDGYFKPSKYNNINGFYNNVLSTSYSNITGIKNQIGDNLIFIGYTTFNALSQSNYSPNTLITTHTYNKKDKDNSNTMLDNINMSDRASAYDPEAADVYTITWKKGDLHKFYNQSSTTKNFYAEGDIVGAVTNANTIEELNSITPTVTNREVSYYIYNGTKWVYLFKNSSSTDVSMDDNYFINGNFNKLKRNYNLRVFGNQNTISWSKGCLLLNYSGLTMANSESNIIANGGGGTITSSTGSVLIGSSSSSLASSHSNILFNSSGDNISSSSNNRLYNCSGITLINNSNNNIIENNSGNYLDGSGYNILHYVGGAHLTNSNNNYIIQNGGHNLNNCYSNIIFNTYVNSSYLQNNIIFNASGFTYDRTTTDITKYFESNHIFGSGCYFRDSIEENNEDIIQTPSQNKVFGGGNELYGGSNFILGSGNRIAGNYNEILSSGCTVVGGFNVVKGQGPVKIGTLTGDMRGNPSISDKSNSNIVFNTDSYNSDDPNHIILTNTSKSFIFGTHSNISNCTNCLYLGRNLNANNQSNQYVFGTYNNLTNAKFVLANGTSEVNNDTITEHRSNAFEIYEDGSQTIILKDKTLSGTTLGIGKIEITQEKIKFTSLKDNSNNEKEIVEFTFEDLQSLKNIEPAQNINNTPFPQI